jgi:metal-responsive CopG/Arc/MetJ family transcriptional regulator
MPLKTPPKKNEHRLVKVVLTYDFLRGIDHLINKRQKKSASWPPESRSDIIRVALRLLFDHEDAL